MPALSARTSASGLRLLVQPDFREIGAEIVARRHRPAHDRLVRGHDAVPPQERGLIRLLEQALLEGTDEALALLHIALAHLLVEQRVELAIVGAAAILGRA